MLINPDPNVINTRGCGPVMRYWFRRGFWENFGMSLFGIAMGSYMVFVFYKNRNEFIQLRDEADDRKRIIQTQSMMSLHSASNNTNQNQLKPNGSRYPYTSLKRSSMNEIGDGYESDDESAGVLNESHSMLNPNA